MKLTDMTLRRPARAGQHVRLESLEEHIVTLGWMAMAATVAAAMILVAYFSI